MSVAGPIPLASGITSSVPADGLVNVIIPAFDDEQQFVGCPYTPHGSDDPPVGARCLVAFDDQHAPWVVAWQSPSS